MTILFTKDTTMSDMKCPFCQQELKPQTMDGEWLECWNCSYHKPSHHPFPQRILCGRKELWQELIRTRKALDVAKGALKEQQRWFGVIRVSLISHLNNQYGTLFKSYDADTTVVNIKRANDILNRALEQITALEQKE